MRDKKNIKEEKLLVKVDNRMFIKEVEIPGKN